MARYQSDELDYMADDYGMTDFEDDAGNENHNRRMLDADSHYEDESDVHRATDTTAIQARRGKDIQGIPWERMNFTRAKYRENRLQQYKNYENVPRHRHYLDKECKHFEKGCNFYDFGYNTRSVKSTVVHFQIRETMIAPRGCIEGGTIFLKAGQRLYPFRQQLMLRNLVWSTSKHDVYLMQNYSIMHWCPLTHKATEVLNVAGHIVPSEKHPGSLPQGLTRVQVSTMSVKDNLVVVGGFQGELVCKHLDRVGVSFCAKITHDENAITNAVEIYNGSSGTTQVMTSNNDCFVRIFDTQKFTVLRRFHFPWSVNHTSVSPDGKLAAILGDNVNCLLADCQTGKAVHILKGHLDYSFASAWHPDGRILATGNQDTTCRLWDMRNLSSSLAVLKGRMGAIRSLRFSSDGRFMVMAEPADFVHIFDTMQDYNKSQEIDLFGEIAGISFSPDTEALYVGVADRTYGSLLEFNRRHANFYLDSVI